MAVVIAIVVLLVIFVAIAARLRSPDPPRVRARRHLPPRPPDRPEGPRPDLPDPDRRPDGPDRPAHGDPDSSAAGGHHQGQRHGQGQRGRLLPGDRPEQGRHRGRELPPRDFADRADDPALGARQGRARFAAVGARAAEHRAPADHRRADRAVGSEGHDGRGQGRRAAGGHAAGDRAPGGGRARAARQDHRRRRRVPSGREALAGGRTSSARTPPPSSSATCRPCWTSG